VEQVTYRPIGIVRSPFRTPCKMPIQPSAAEGAEGRIEVLSEFSEGLQDLEGFSHLVLIYHLHLSRGFSLLVRPFLDDELRGVFATRAPRRPNAIGLSVVRLVAVDSTTLHIRDVDIVDETPLLDVKPHIPEIDPQGPYLLGWLEGKVWKLAAARSDDRFET
jgi:tRNA-Thr(GGU) m(6)t(6)A37 methyltransferase TsaA